MRWPRERKAAWKGKRISVRMVRGRWGIQEEAVSERGTPSSESGQQYWKLQRAQDEKLRLHWGVTYKLARGILLGVVRKLMMVSHPAKFTKNCWIVHLKFAWNGWILWHLNYTSVKLSKKVKNEKKKCPLKFGLERAMIPGELSSL